MQRSRRQIANRLIEAIGISLVALDLAVFFAVYRPLGKKLDGQVARDAALRETVRTEQRRVELLRKYELAFPQAGKALEEFTENRTPSRREAFSIAAHLIHNVASDSGVTVTTLVYRLDNKSRDSLQKLTLEISAQGPYGGLLKFSHDLETANDFIVIRQFIFTPGADEAGPAAPGAGQPVALRLGADLYLTP